MRMTLKRLTAWMLTLMMIFSCVSASAVDGNVVDYSDSTSAYDVMPQDDSTSENITITFVVDNEYYVKDPNSGNTHLRVLRTDAAAFTDRTLKLVEWSGQPKWWKIASTGTVSTYSIPSGSTLKDAGVTLPALDVFNCTAVATPQDGYRYNSLKSWVTESGTVCNNTTVFTEDTTLYLQLSVGSIYYTIDFVCGEDNHSIATSGPFQLGQTLAENYMTEATVAANKFTSDFCTHGPASNEVLSAWQLHNYRTDSRVNLTTGLEITSDYATTQYGSAIKAYAVWEPGVKISFKYVAPYNNTLDLGTLVVKPGAKFGDILGIPDAYQYNRNDTFIGWQYTDTAGNLKYATEDTVISAGMEFNAIFGTPVYARFQYTYFDETTQENVTKTVEERARLSGDALGTLPTLTDYGIDSVVWQYTDSNNVVRIATADTEITADTYFTAVTETPQVTATFQYATSYKETGEPVYETIETRTLNASDVLGALPDMTEYNTLFETFAGWQYGTDAEGNPQYATAETVITADTVFTAVFTEVECGEIFFYDVLPNGSTSEEPTLSLLMPIGMTLEEVLEYSEEWIDDEKLLSECVWRTAIDGDLADLTAVVTADREIHLYTHTYQIVLTLKLNTVSTAAFTSTTRASVNTDTTKDDTITMTITAREGEKLTENDFIVDGTDLTQYAWKDGNGNPIDLQTLMDEGVTESITATSDGTLAATDLTLTLVLTLDGETKTYTITKAEGETFAASDFVIDGLDLTVFTWTRDQGTVSLTSLVNNELMQDMTLTSDGTLDSGLEEGSLDVNFYVYIDNEPVRIASKTVTTYKEHSKNRRYLSAATLASVYGKYGFEASQLTVGTHYFPHVDAGGSTLWCNTAVLLSNGMYFSPITNGGVADVYYLPARSITGTGEKRDEAIVKANTFYTVTVEDPAGKVYTNDTLPERTITFTGGSTSMTVKKADGVTWSCLGQETGTTVNDVDNGDGTITFNINGITEPYIISASFDDVVIVQYDRNLSQTPSDLEYGVPMINGAETHTDIVLVADADEYKALSLNPSSYFYESGKYQGEEVFLGWAVNGNTAEGSLIPAGGTLDLSAYGGQTVTLTAQWETHMGGTIGGPRQSSMVNFFVSFNAISEGSSSWIGQTKTSNFTPSVYTMDCGVIGQDVIDNLMNHVHQIEGEAGQYAVIGDTSGGNLNKAHWDIVNQLTAGYTLTGSNGKDYNFTGTFPTDEHVLRTIRQMMADNPAMSIRINGREIEASELTTTNFTIRWYVFKLASTDTDTFKDDGWHIDGILVAKSGELIVTKTFAGDNAGISAVIGNFNVKVSGGDVHKGGTLSPRNATSVNGNTYTWKVPVDQYYDYTITENSYEYTVNQATYKSRYRVRHSLDEDQNTGWTSYNSNSNITVTGRGYNETDDERLQVDFLNTYTSAGTVVVQKIDAATGNLMPNVSFRIGGTRGDENGTELKMYHVQGSHYSAEPGFGTLTDTITTDASGQAYLWIGGGNYWLEEIVPDGYDDPGRITVELAGAADNSYKVVEITSASAANAATAGKNFVSIDGDDELTLIVKNYSRTIDLKVTKDWLNNENKPVTIQLYRGGKPMGADYTVTLDGSENWTHTFEDLPLYADGGLARYTIREEKIGDFMYSDEFTTGYLYYDVDYSSMKYLDARGNVTTDMTQVKTIALEASNDRNHGSLSIGKVDEKNVALGGAVFYLYEATTGSTVPSVIEDDDGHNVLTGYTQVGEATSAANGVVDFGTVNAGRYYLIEHSAPEGYIGSDLVYLVQFDGTNVTMQYYAANEDGTGGWTTTAKRVTNTSVTVDIPVTKKWVDNDNEFGRRPNSINVTLTGTDSDGKVVSTQTVTLTADNSDNNFSEGETAKQSDTWTHTFEDLPQYVSGKAVTYTVSESVIAGYTPVYDQTNHKITNTLAQNLSFKVNKLVEGNFADKKKAFNFTAVAYNAAGEEVARQTFTLAHGGSKIIENLPYGAYIVVTEKPDGYTAQYMLGTTRTNGESYTSGALLDSNQGVTFINTKNVTVDTGVDLDGLPYALLLLGVVGIAVVWLLLYLGRRKED